MNAEPALDELILFLRNQLEPSMRKKIQGHLDEGCARCETEIKWLRRVISTAGADPQGVPPAGLQELTRRVFHDFQRRMAESDPSILHGILVFDSTWVAVPEGARAPVSGQRRYLFSAPPFEIDMEVSRLHRGAYDLIGQIIPSDQVPPATEASLVSRPARSTRLDPQGVFSFEKIAPGTLDLALRLGERTIRLSQIRIG